MNVQEAYNHWSATYDTDTNLTRDLDRLVTTNTLSNLKFKSAIELGCGTGKNTSNCKFKKLGRIRSRSRRICEHEIN
jgi:ubiquinone/menaquinone biosynthesis C-methylase UbiE